MYDEYTSELNVRLFIECYYVEHNWNVCILYHWSSTLISSGVGCKMIGMFDKRWGRVIQNHLELKRKIVFSKVREGIMFSIVVGFRFVVNGRTRN